MKWFAALLRWRWRRHATAFDRDYIDGQIAANRARYRYEGFRPELRERSEQRRRAADAIKTRAARVESGAVMSDVLRRVV